MNANVYLSLVTTSLLILNGHCYLLWRQNNGVEHENDVAKAILVHLPGTEMTLSLLHPEANYYATAMSTSRAQSQHNKLQKALGLMNATVYELRDVLLRGTQEKYLKPYINLLEFASHYLTYDCSNLERELEETSMLNATSDGKLRDEINKKLDEIRPKLTAEYQESYRKSVLSNVSQDALVEIILNRPTIVLHLKSWFIGKKFYVALESETKVKPIGNLYFLRDQQVTTKRGIILLRSVRRDAEKNVTKFVMEKLGYSIIGELQRGIAGGGDFFPLGDIIFVGQGLKTTSSAIHEMMEKDYFGTTEVAVIKDVNDFDEDRAFLDDFFNVLDNKGNVVVLKNVLEDESKRRYVDLYSKKSNDSKNYKKKYGQYVKMQSNVEFGQFLQNRGFNLTLISDTEQQGFAANFLNIGNGTIVSRYGEVTFLKRLESLGVKVQTVYIKDLSGGNGGVHAMTHVLSRQRSHG